MDGHGKRGRSKKNKKPLTREDVHEIIRRENENHNKSRAHSNDSRKSTRSHTTKEGGKGKHPVYPTPGVDSHYYGACDDNISIAGSAFGARSGPDTLILDPNTKQQVSKKFNAAVQYTHTSPTGTNNTGWYLMTHSGKGAAPGWNDTFNKYLFTGKSGVYWAWIEGGSEWALMRIFGDGTGKPLGAPGNPIHGDSDKFQTLCASVFCQPSVTTMIRCSGKRLPTVQEVYKMLSSYANKYNAVVTLNGETEIVVTAMLVNGKPADAASMTYTISIVQGETEYVQAKDKDDKETTHERVYATITAVPKGTPTIPGVAFQYQ